MVFGQKHFAISNKCQHIDQNSVAIDNIDGIAPQSPDLVGSWKYLGTFVKQINEVDETYSVEFIEREAIIERVDPNYDYFILKIIGFVAPGSAAPEIIADTYICNLITIDNRLAGRGSGTDTDNGHFTFYNFDVDDNNRVRQFQGVYQESGSYTPFGAHEQHPVLNDVKFVRTDD